MNSRVMKRRTCRATAAAVVMTVLYTVAVALPIYMGNFSNVSPLVVGGTLCLTGVWVCVAFLWRFLKARIVLEWAKAEMDLHCPRAACRVLDEAMNNPDGTERDRFQWGTLVKFYNQHPDYDPEMEKKDA